MTSFIRNTICLLGLGFGLAAPAMAQEPARAAADCTTLETLRAGATSAAGRSYAADERAILAAASAPTLEVLRATDVSLDDGELRLILITAAVVVVLIILL